jgi:hypothetical protein
MPVSQSKPSKAISLAYVDAEVRHIEFHGLRHTYNKMIGNAGVLAREHMDLARQSSCAMTARYPHSRFYDVAVSVQPLLTRQTTRTSNAKRVERQARMAQTPKIPLSHSMVTTGYFERLPGEGVILLNGQQIDQKQTLLAKWE